MVRMVRKFEVGGVYHAGGVPYKVTRISADREFAWFREPGKEERYSIKIRQHMTIFPEYIWSEEADPPHVHGLNSIIPPACGIRATALVFYDLTDDTSSDDERFDWGDESDEETDSEEEVNAVDGFVVRAAKSQRIE